MKALLVGVCKTRTGWLRMADGKCGCKYADENPNISDRIWVGSAAAKKKLRIKKYPVMCELAMGL